MNTPGASVEYSFVNTTHFLTSTGGSPPCCKAPNHAGTPPLSLNVHHVKAAFVLPYFYTYRKIEKRAVSLGTPPPSSVSSCGFHTALLHVCTLRCYHQPGTVSHTLGFGCHWLPTDFAVVLFQDPGAHTYQCLSWEDALGADCWIRSS